MKKKYKNTIIFFLGIIAFAVVGIAYFLGKLYESAPQEAQLVPYIEVDESAPLIQTNSNPIGFRMRENS